MEKVWILQHFDATFDHWSVAGRKEHIISLKNKEINQSPAHSKRKKKKKGNLVIKAKVASLLKTMELYFSLVLIRDPPSLRRVLQYPLFLTINTFFLLTSKTSIMPSSPDVLPSLGFYIKKKVLKIRHNKKIMFRSLLRIFT